MYSWQPLFMLIMLTAEVLSYDGVSIGDLPSDVGAQLVDILTNFFPNLQENCTESPNPKVDFLLYTRDNPNNPIILDPKNPSQVDPRRKILLVIHGWLANPTVSYIQKLKDAYLQQSNLHLIAVDWTQSAKGLYTDAFCDVPEIGKRVSEFLAVLKENKVRLYTLSVIGHSMGAHIAGYMGKRLHDIYKEHVARITGLDPARSLYEGKPANERLDVSDAELVDVIHTDTSRMGYYNTFNAVHFYPNCGVNQPGCPSISGLNNDTLITDALCSSLRSLEYMTESIGTENFVGESCGICPRSCSADIINGVEAIMGENYKPVEPPAHKHLYFTLRTESTPPYALGPVSNNVHMQTICENFVESPFNILKRLCNFLTA